MKNDIFSKNIFQNVNIQNFKENPMSRPAPSVCKWNKIINFVLSVKLGEEIFFLQGLLKANIFYANRFLYDLQKKFKNKNVLFYSFTYLLFRTFFLKWIIKQFFFEVGNPLKGRLFFWGSGGFFFYYYTFLCDYA